MSRDIYVCVGGGDVDPLCSHMERCQPPPTHTCVLEYTDRRTWKLASLGVVGTGGGNLIIKGAYGMKY